uniref:Transcriptional regulator, TetR family n=1 Tax=Sphingomonas sp. JE1 TaxID=1628059 RepID=A0A0D5A007_9SPHN|nr:Transcriptional regulator, TetR family [Sphingomonas sp. JE1]
MLYQYFDDKRDLLYKVILEILERYNRDIPSALSGVTDPLLRLQTAAIAYYRVIDDRVPATLFSYRESRSLDRDQRAALKAKELQTNNLIKDRIDECINAGFCIDFNPELATYWIISSAHAWGLKHWRLAQIVSFEDYVRQSLGVILNGMLNEAGHRHWSAHNLLDGRPLP